MDKLQLKGVEKDMLESNLGEVSLVARRLVHDAVSASGIDISKFEVSNELLKACSQSHNKYRMHLLDKEKDNEVVERQKKRKCVTEELHDAKKRKLELEKTVEKLLDGADKKAKDAEKMKNPLQLIMESNAARKRAKDLKKKEIPQLEKEVEQLEKELKQMKK